MMAPIRILVVEDDQSIQLGLRMSLERAGYEVGMADNGAVALDLLRQQSWDICILDIMLPRLNGYEVLRVLRNEEIDTAILILSARGADDDKILGLDLGAEDYITKPFSVPELLARVRAAVRRRTHASNGTGSLRFGDVVVDARRREVRRGGELVDLTVTEFNVLETLAKANGETLTRQQIFESVWGEGHHGTFRTIDNFIAQLRSKLEQDPAAPSHLVTVRGVGYRLTA